MHLAIDNVSFNHLKIQDFVDWFLFKYSLMVIILLYIVLCTFVGDTFVFNFFLSMVNFVLHFVT